MKESQTAWNLQVSWLAWSPVWFSFVLQIWILTTATLSGEYYSIEELCNCISLLSLRTSLLSPLYLAWRLTPQVPQLHIAESVIANDKVKMKMKSRASWGPALSCGKEILMVQLSSAVSQRSEVWDLILSNYPSLPPSLPPLLYLRWPLLTSSPPTSICCDVVMGCNIKLNCSINRTQSTQ